MSIYGNWELRRFTRREALAAGGVAAAALALRPDRAFGDHVVNAYGPLVARPEGNISLPRGFQYRIISEAGKPMSDGRPTPGDPDGQVALRGPRNITVLVRNHELGFRDDDIQAVVSTPDKQYDPAERGGTTAIWVSPNRRNVRDYVTSSGTANNCAGGGTPWGTWLTCEEDRDAGHGYVFEVVYDDPEGPLTRQPIFDMGFFSHEAVDIDPSTGIAYLTEDDFRGQRLPADPRNEVEGPVEPGDPGTQRSFLYRYIPNDRSRRAGALQQGGTLQSMKIDEAPRNADLYDEGDRFVVRWVDVDPDTAPESAEAQGCVRFNRLEGAHFAGGAYWFDDTSGGESRLGQVFRYFPATNTLELFMEGTTKNEMEAPDNVVVTPWGDLWFAEDGRDDENRVMGITPEGHVYKFASTVGSEFAGPTFAPDGRTFFLSAQDHGLTYAIWGPFARRNRARARAMAIAAPPAGRGPEISGELSEAAVKYGMSDLEAAAFDRLGAPLV